MAPLGSENTTLKRDTDRDTAELTHLGEIIANRADAESIQAEATGSPPKGRVTHDIQGPEDLNQTITEPEQKPARIDSALVETREVIGEKGTEFEQVDADI